VRFVSEFVLLSKQQRGLILDCSWWFGHHHQKTTVQLMNCSPSQSHCVSLLREEGSCSWAFPLYGFCFHHEMAAFGTCTSILWRDRPSGQGTPDTERERHTHTHTNVSVCVCVFSTNLKFCRLGNSVEAAKCFLGECCERTQGRREL
jgi:hypothetical protein